MSQQAATDFNPATNEVDWPVFIFEAQYVLPQHILTELPRPTFLKNPLINGQQQEKSDEIGRTETSRQKAAYERDTDLICDALTGLIRCLELKSEETAQSFLERFLTAYPRHREDRIVIELIPILWSLETAKVKLQL